jgi:hypothetical protein
MVLVILPHQILEPVEEAAVQLAAVTSTAARVVQA